MRISRHVVTIVSVFILAACSESYPIDPVARYTGWEIGDFSQQMLLEGTLEIQNGCLVVTSPDGKNSVPVFPQQLVAWDADTGILTYHGVEYSIGDEVMIGYGTNTNAGSGEIPRACADSGPLELHYVQSDSLVPLHER